MKAFLAVLLFVGLTAAALPPRGAITGVLQDLQKKLVQDAKQVAGHIKEDYQLALKQVQEASQAIAKGASRENLKTIKDNLKASIQKVAADGRDDSQVVVGHLKEAFKAIQSALKPPARKQ